jgi:hypothetical protein
MLLSWVRPVVAVSFLSLLAIWATRPYVSGDTPFVLDGTNALIDCLSRHDFHACGFTGHLNVWHLMSPIGDWPLLQHVPDLISIALGATSHPDRVDVLVGLNVAAVLISVILGRMVLSRAGQAGWFWGFQLVVLSGPILAYANQSAGEALASGLLVCLVAAALLQAPPPVVALAALAACLTKETSYPFVVALGLLGLVLARRRTGKPIRRHVAWGAAGVVLAFVFASLFNVVRFGSVLNTNYLQPELHTPGVSRKLEYAAALLVSPSGGILVVWPAATALLLAGCLMPLAFRTRTHIDARPALVLAASFLALIAGLASWYTPFGWAAFGPRFTFPWMPPLVLIALVAYGEPLAELTRRLLAPRWRLLLVATVILALALPEVGYMWRPQTGFFTLKTGPCKGLGLAVGTPQFYACQHELMWFRRPYGLYALPGLRTTGGALMSVAVAVGLLGCLILLREEVQRPRSRLGDRLGSDLRERDC